LFLTHQVSRPAPLHLLQGLEAEVTLT
jgi:hypothetical protein